MRVFFVFEALEPYISFFGAVNSSNKGGRVLRDTSPCAASLVPSPLATSTPPGLGLPTKYGHMGALKGAVPITSMGAAPFNVYRQFQRVNRVLEYLVDPALPL